MVYEYGIHSVSCYYYVIPSLYHGTPLFQGNAFCESAMNVI